MSTQLRAVTLPRLRRLRSLFPQARRLELRSPLRQYSSVPLSESGRNRWYFNRYTVTWMVHPGGIRRFRSNRD